jgi:hypothetical protein
MAEFFDYNKANGMRYDTEDDGDEKLIIQASQDIAPIVDHMKEKQKKGDDGIKRGYWHYCSIPTVVEVELRKKGINIYNKHQTKELLREINTNYPYLKATRKHHE